MYEYTDPEILLKGMQLELDYFNQLITTLIWIICLWIILSIIYIYRSESEGYG